MERKVKYIDINQVLSGMREQIVDSIDYCVNEMPTFNTPKQLFDFCKLMVVYKNDPDGTELLQSVPTLADNNYWGVPFCGDCDCFTILTISMCIANGWNDNQIVLVGRVKKAPVHVYSAVIVDGKRYILDLTNPYIDIERKYKYRQVIDC